MQKIDFSKRNFRQVNSLVQNIVKYRFNFKNWRCS